MKLARLHPKGRFDRKSPSLTLTSLFCLGIVFRPASLATFYWQHHLVLDSLESFYPQAPVVFYSLTQNGPFFPLDHLEMNSFRPSEQAPVVTCANR